MERDAVIILRAPKAVKEALRRAAVDEQRSSSSMALRIITQKLDEQGYLDPPKRAKRRRGR
jgi:hypothetical protein